jgi:hypothetical protein
MKWSFLPCESNPCSFSWTASRSWHLPRTCNTITNRITTSVIILNCLHDIKWKRGSEPSSVGGRRGVHSCHPDSSLRACFFYQWSRFFSKIGYLSFRITQFKLFTTFFKMCWTFWILQVYYHSNRAELPWYYRGLHYVFLVKWLSW